MSTKSLECGSPARPLTRNGFVNERHKTTAAGSSPAAVLHPVRCYLPALAAASFASTDFQFTVFHHASR